MDYGKAITYVFQDKNWLATILVGGGISLLGLFFFWTIIGPFLAYALVLGYMMQLIRDVQRDPDAGLPPWEDWGKKLTDGVKLMVAQFLWQLPLILLTIPMLTPMVLSAIYPDSDTLVILGFMGYFSFLCFAFLYSLFFLIIQPALVINLTVHNQFAKAFDIAGIFAIIREHLGEVLIIALLTFGLGYFASWIGMLLLLIGVVFTSFWVMLVQGHLYGQLARLVFPSSPTTTSLTPSSTTEAS